MATISVRHVERPGRIANPTGIETHVDDEILHFRYTAPVVRVEEKTARGTEDILAEVALDSVSRFAALGNLMVLAVRTSDCDTCRHGPLLPDGCWEDLAQCDINVSRPPLLRHYCLGDEVFSVIVVQCAQDI